MTSPRRGFTLIELMIVVAIIGILSAIAVPRFAQLLRKSNEGACKGSLGGIRSALAIYYGDLEGQYPNDMTSLTLSGKYLQAIPVSKTPPYHSDQNGVNYGTSAAFTDVGNWQYDNVTGDREMGMVWVNCTHTDSKSASWSSY